MAIYMWREAPWIYHNSTLWLISLSSDGTNWITIADKNLWATTVYNNWDTLSESNCGKYYQWGNNYGFPWTWSITTSSTTIDASTYWPWNYYSSSTFIISWNSWWDNSWNANLRWDTTNTLEARRWPCSEWYHVPSSYELDKLILICTTLWAWELSGTNYSVTKMPFAWCRSETDGSVSYQNSRALYWSSTPSTTDIGKWIWIVNGSQASFLSNWRKTGGRLIRPFKNTPVQPDSSWTVLYQQ